MTTSIKEPDKLRLLESLFPSHQSSFDESPWTESAQTVDRRISSHRGLQRLLNDNQRSQSPSGIATDTGDTSDDMMRQWAARKHRKRVLPDGLTPAAQTDYSSALTVEHLTEFPRRGKIRRRQHASSRRRDRQRGRTRKHRHSDIEREQRSEVSPIDVAIRLLGSRARHHHSRRRHRHWSTRRRARALRTPSVMLDNIRQRRGRLVSKQRRSTTDLSRAARHNMPLSAVARHRQSSSTQYSSTTPSDPISAVSPSSDAAEVKSTSTDLPLIYRMRRSLSTSHSRVPRDMDKQRQRLVLEKLLESSMSEAERTARKLTSSRLDELLGKSYISFSLILLLFIIFSFWSVSSIVGYDE